MMSLQEEQTKMETKLQAQISKLEYTLHMYVLRWVV